LTLAGVIHTSAHAERRSGRAEQRSSVALEQAQVAQEISSAIQEDRRRTTLESCRAQNDHHHAAVKTLDGLLVKGRRLPRAQQRKARGAVVLVVNALAPVEDCKAKADRVVGLKP
jgi:hypothetical protein